MQVKHQFFGSWAQYLSFGTCYEVNIMQLCSVSIHNLYTYSVKCFALGNTQNEMHRPNTRRVCYFLKEQTILSEILQFHEF